MTEVDRLNESLNTKKSIEEDDSNPEEMKTLIEAARMSIKSAKNFQDLQKAIKSTDTFIRKMKGTVSGPILYHTRTDEGEQWARLQFDVKVKSGTANDFADAVDKLDFMVVMEIEGDDTVNVTTEI